ncbi:MAG: putative TIM-barrel fold metal-dependent hydrolase, partial [Caulobacteraceae bacterium]|nr:putative TIM-barrel fold metal-dependent hydrolase [Caulobacteraceae bacterium]
MPEPEENDHPISALEDAVFISTDDHAIEPADLWQRYMPSKFKDQAPRYLEDEISGYWQIEDRKLRAVANASVAGRPPWEYGLEPTSYEQLRLGCYDVHARVDDMNVGGYVAAMCFPNTPGCAGQTFREGKDKALMYACIQAWNDWYIDEWCGAYPGRFIPLAILPVWDVTLCVDELRRVKKKGCNAFSMVAIPPKADLPSFHSDYWNPLWAFSNDEGMTVAVHIGDTTSVASSLDAPYDTWICGFPVSLFYVASDILWSPILRKYPQLKFVMSEGGAGWIPHMYDRVDFVYQQHRWWTHQDFGDKLPSEVLKEHMFTCILDDPTAVEMRHRVGVDTMTWECDYPHSDSIWPRGPETLWRDFKKFKATPDEIEKITHRNAMRAFNFDPFKHARREDITVGALRAQAKAKGVNPGFLFNRENPGFTEPPGGIRKEFVTMANREKYGVLAASWKS